MLHNYQNIVLLKKIKFLMNSEFDIQLNGNKKISNKSIQVNNYGFLYNDLLNSRTFWIGSIYFFLSVTLLTGVHMYEYFKCFLC